MSCFEEKDNDGSEEEPFFGTEEGANVHMLGCWIDPNDDLKNRNVTAGALWWNIKPQLKNSQVTLMRSIESQKKNLYPIMKRWKKSLNDCYILV